MLDQSTGEYPAVRSLRAASKVLKCVIVGGIQPELATSTDHFLVAVDAEWADADFSQQIEELASPAPDVHDFMTAREVRNVPALALRDLLRGASEPFRRTWVVYARARRALCFSCRCACQRDRVDFDR